MSNFITLSDVKLKEKEMEEARGGETFNQTIVKPGDLILCYGVPDPIWDDLLQNDPY